MRIPHLSPRAYQRVTQVALAALVFIIVTGGAVRLTGSGLGCSDWPTCEQGQLVAPLELRPMIEFVNRMITGLVSAAVIVAVLASLVRDPRRRDLTGLSLGLVGGVLAQIVLGGIVVKVGLSPVSVTGHYLVSIILVWNALVLARRAGQGEGPPVPVTSRAVRDLGRAIVVTAGVVLIAGTFVTGAGPHAGDERAPRYALAIADVARIHGIAVWCFLAVTLCALWRLRRDGAPPQVDTQARLLVVAILGQGALGYAQYFSGVPVALVFLHIFGSVLVFIAALNFHLSLFTRPLREPGTAELAATGRNAFESGKMPA